MLRLAIDPETHEADLCEPDESSDIATAAILSLRCDATARPADLVTERSGYWGDAYADDEGDVWGCRLWELGEAADGDDSLRRAEEYAREAWDWAIEDGVVSSVKAVAFRQSGGRIIVDMDVHVVGEQRPRRFRVAS